MKKETARMIFEGGQNAELLAAIADVVGKEIVIHRAGVGSAGDVVKLGDDRYILSPRLRDDKDYQDQGPWEMSYAIRDNGAIVWVWIGHKLLGPCYQCGSDGKWRNCYSHGNFGNNFSSGGTWSGSKEAGHRNGKCNSDANNGQEYDSLKDCVLGRADEIKRAPKTAIFMRYAAIPAIPPVLFDGTKNATRGRDAKGRYCKS